MNRNSVRTTLSTIFVINPEVLQGELMGLISQLTKQLPDCELKVMEKNQHINNICGFPNNTMFLVLNSKDCKPSTLQLITRLEEDQRRYVVYPEPISVSQCSGYKATTFSELLRYLSQMIMENIGSVSQISSNTINRAEKPNVSLHIIIAKSKDEEFRRCVKSIYKNYKDLGHVDFFESKSLEKIHTSLFPRIVFIINQADVQTYRAGYQVFMRKKTEIGKIMTILFSGKSYVSPYGFEYDEAANSKESLEQILLKHIQQKTSSRPISASKAIISNNLQQRNHQSSIQPSIITNPSQQLETFIFVLDSVDSVYRLFYSQIKYGYQRVNHLNIPFGSKSILIVPSSTKNLEKIGSYSSVKIILVTEESAPNMNAKYEKGVELVTNNIDELNYFLKKETMGTRRVTDVKQISTHSSTGYNVSVSPFSQTSSPRISSQQATGTQTNLEYTVTEYNQQTHRSLKSSNSSTPRIGTSEIILRETKDNMNSIINNYISQEGYNQQYPRVSATKPAQIPIMPRVSYDRKPSITLAQNEYGGEQLDEIIEAQTKSSIKMGSKRSSSSSVNHEPQLDLQSQINAGIVRDSMQINEKSNVRQRDSLVTHSSNIVPPRVSMYRQKVSTTGERRSMMRNTPDYYNDGRRTSSHKQNIGGFASPQRSSMAQQMSKNRQMSQIRSSEYYTSGITSSIASNLTSPQKSSRPKSSRIAGKLSVIECLGNTRSKTLSEMLEKHSRSIRQHSQIDEFQLDFGQQSSLQIIFRVSSSYIQHLSLFFEVYPSTIIRYSDTNELLGVLPSLNKSSQTILVLDSQIVENVRVFKGFQDFNYIIVCKQQNIARLKHKFPNTVLMKESTHNKSFKQLLSYIRYLKFKQEEFKISDKQLIPHISAIRTMKIYCPDEPALKNLICDNMNGFEVVNYRSEEELLGMLENNLFGSEGVHNVLIVKNAEERLIQYLVSSIFNVKKIIVYGGQEDLPQLSAELGKIGV